MLQISMRIDDPFYVKELIQEISDRVVGLHCRVVNGNICSYDGDIQLFELPTHISLLDEANMYVYKNFSVPNDIALGSIAYKNDIITLNINHSCADGCFLTQLVSSLGKSGEHFHEKIPKTIYNVFGEQISKCTFLMKRSTHDPDILRFHPREAPHIVQNDNSGKMCFEIDFKNMSSYCPQKNGLVSNTEHVWAALILSASAYNEKITSGGISTIYNMRKHLSLHSFDWNLCNFVASITSYPDIIDPHETLNVITQRMRLSLETSIDQGRMFSQANLLRSIMEGKNLSQESPLLGEAVEMSSIGIFRGNQPISDIRFSLESKAKGVKNIITVLTYSVQTHEKQYFACQFCYDPSKISKSDAQLIVEYMQRALKVVTLDMEFGAALEALNDKSGTLNEYQP